MSSLLETRKRYSNFIFRLSNASTSTKPAIFALGWFLLWPWTFFGLAFVRFFLEFPVHLFQTPTVSFSSTAARDTHGAFLESYNAYLRRQRLSVVTAVLIVVFIAGQVYVTGLSLLRVSKPTQAEAYNTSTTLNPTYDSNIQLVAGYGDDGFGGCALISSNYTCGTPSSTVLTVSGKFNNLFDCSLGGYSDTDNYSLMKFDLSSIPSNAVVTQVQLIVNVTATTTGGVNVIHPTSDTIDSLACTDNTAFNAVDSGTAYLTGQSWGTIGVKTYILGSTANSNIQSRLGGSNTFGLALSAPVATKVGTCSSTDAASNKPQLVISYTLPPQAPTATSHSSISTTSITWTWTDNATAETRYDVKDTGNTSVTGCTNLAANSSSCTETGLSANTQYTRHPNVTDTNGNTDGPTASSYTAIQTPTSTTKVSATTTSLTVQENGSLSNLGTGQAAVFFLDTVTNNNSGWITTTTWTESGLTPGSTHNVKVKARNGDGVETSYTATVNIILNASAPNITPTQSINTWYNNEFFDFTDNTIGGTVSIAWNKNTTYNFPDPAIPDPLVSPFTVDATSEGLWYLHAASYDNAGHPSGGSVTIGPFEYDATAPTTPASVNDGAGADAIYTSTSTTLSANWTASTDALSGLAKYQYAIGTTSGGVNVVNWTDGTTSASTTKSGLSLSEGQIYFVSVRAVDNTGNISTIATSNGITVDSGGPSAPTTVNDGTGADISTTTSTTTLSANWTASTDSGSGLQKYQYAIGTTLGGTNIVPYTDNALSTSITVSGLSLTLNTTYYISVRAVDALGNIGSSTSSNGATVVSASIPTTTLSAIAAATPTTMTATITWTTNELATSRVDYGLTMGYGSFVANNVATSSHQLDIANLSAGQTYHFIVTSTGSTTAISADATFIMPAAATAPRTANISAPTLLTPIIQDGSAPSVIVTGVTKGQQSVIIMVDGKAVGRVDVGGAFGSTQSFSFRILTRAFAAGKHTISVKSKDASGQTSITKTGPTFTIGQGSTLSIQVNRATTYTVQSGDSLWKIAAHFQLSGNDFGKLILANVKKFPSLATHPNIIQPGWILTIPAP